MVESPMCVTLFKKELDSFQVLATRTTVTSFTGDCHINACQVSSYTPLASSYDACYNNTSNIAFNSINTALIRCQMTQPANFIASIYYNAAFSQPENCLIRSFALSLSRSLKSLCSPLGRFLVYESSYKTFDLLCFGSQAN